MVVVEVWVVMEVVVMEVVEVHLTVGGRVGAPH